MGEHLQTGLVAAASVAAYDTDRIKKHELTRPVKEDDRVRQIDALNAQTGPVFLVYKSTAVIDDILAAVSASEPEWISRPATACATSSGWWTTARPSTGCHRLRRSLRPLRGGRAPPLRRRLPGGRSPQGRNPKHTGEESYNYFLTVIFPHNQMQILDYNRVVKDLHGLDVSAFMAGSGFRSRWSSAPSPSGRHATEFGMYLDGAWYRLTLDPAPHPLGRPGGRLDVSLLQDNMIEPCSASSTQRRDDRIGFVGGIRGLDGLARRVDEGGMKVAFSLHPTRMED